MAGAECFLRGPLEGTPTLIYGYHTGRSDATKKDSGIGEKISAAPQSRTRSVSSLGSPRPRLFPAAAGCRWIVGAALLDGPVRYPAQ